MKMMSILFHEICRLQNSTYIRIQMVHQQEQNLFAYVLIWILKFWKEVIFNNNNYLCTETLCVKIFNFIFMHFLIKKKHRAESGIYWYSNI